MAFETITNEAGATTGYTYAITEGDVTNTITYDANFEQIGEAVVDSAAGTEFSNTVIAAADGSYVESGTEKYTVAGSDETFERTFEFKYDSSGVLTEGTEVINGETIEYGADFEVTSVTADTSGLTALSEEARSALPAAMISSVAADAAIFTSTESFGDDFSETTYYDANGSILGYSNDFSHSWGNETMTGTDFMDADWEYLGHSGSDGEATWSHFETRGTDADGNVTITETGSETYGGETREFTFVFDENFNLISGEETIDGVTTEYGANWSVTGETADVSALGDALSETALSGVPTALVSSLDDGLTYSKTEQFDWGGSETTYFNSEGTTLGFSFSFEDNFGSSVSYEDANHNWLGGSWSDNEGRSGYNSTSQSTDESGNLIYIETGGFSDTNTGESSTFTWRFDSNWNMIGGTETRGSTTYTYGANWEITDSSTEIDLESGEFAVLDLASLPDLVVANLFAGQETVYIAEEEFPWGGKQTTYFTADGDVIGYGDSWDDDWGSGTTYMNADWEFIGSEWDDNWGSGYQFTVQGSESDDFAYNEFGEQTWINYNGEEETRSFDFKFDENWNLISGTETMDDGSTITFGANWEIVSETRTVNLEADNIVALTDEQKADLPDALVATTGDTYAETNTMPWGDTETTYLTADGIILGYSHAWSDEEYGSSGVSYNDADWNHLGSSWEDQWGSGYNFTEESIDTDGTWTGTAGSKIYIENGGGTFKDHQGEEVFTNMFVFDENWNMLGGEEVDGDITIVYGKDWQIISQTADISDLETLDMSMIPPQVIDILFDGHDTVKFTIETFPWGGEQSTYYDAEGNILGYSDYFDDPWAEGENFMDADWNHVGGYWQDAETNAFNYNFFSEDTDENGNYIRTEVGQNVWHNFGQAEYSVYEYIFDEFGNLVSGYEYIFDQDPIQNGGGADLDPVAEIEFGANWEILSETKDLDVEGNDKISILDSEDKTELPDALVAETGETIAEISWQSEDGNYQDITYYNEEGEVLGYSNSWKDPQYNSQGVSYNDAEWNHLGSYYEDQYGSGFNFTVEAIDTDGSVTGTAGSLYYIETGENTHKGPDGNDETNTREFLFSADWEMLGGKETFGNETITYGPNWTILSQATDVSNLTTMSDFDDLPTPVVTALFGTLSASEVKSSVENFTWGEGSQTTYYDLSGNVLGYRDTWKDDYSNGSGESFMDENWNHIGNKWSDDFGSGYNFTVEEYNNAGELVSRTESGENSWKDPQGQTETRTFEYKYDADWNLIEGKETGSDGVEITYGANWEILGQKVDISGLTALTDQEKADVPDPLKAASGDTFASTENFQWGGSQTTYYDASGAILGYEDSWSDDQGGGGSSFMDAEWNFLGSSWSDQYGSGESIRIDNYDSSGNFTGHTEKGSNTWKNDQDQEETRSFEFNFNAAGEMTGGTETHPDGRTVTLGPNWEVQGEKMDVSGLSTVSSSDLADLPTALKAASGDTYYSTSDMEWGSGKQTTYLDGDGKVLGYKDTWSEDWDGDGTVDNEGFSYMDSNWNHLGGGGTDDYGTWSSITVTNSDGTITETRTNADADGNFSRTEVSNYDANYMYTGGEEIITETINGVTQKTWLVFDANRNVIAEYGDDGSGDGFAVSDPFALFQPGNFVISNADLEYYVTNAENLVLRDFDNNGVSDAIEEDLDGDGNVDAVYNFAKHLLQSTMFAPDLDPTPIMDGSNISGVTINGTTESVSDHIKAHYNKFDLTMTGDLTMASGGTGPEDISGTITAISISHIPSGSTTPVVIATNSSLSIKWSDLMGKVEGPDDGPKAVDGYYPLYHDKADAEQASTVGTAHQHKVKDSNGELDMWMPDGGTEGTDYFHGSYSDMSKDDPELDIVTTTTTTPSDPVNGDVFNVSGSEWVLVAESNNTFTLIPVKDEAGSLVYDSSRTSMRDLDESGVDQFLGDPPTFNENIASNTSEFDAIKAAANATGPNLADGDVYIVNTNEKLLLVEKSDGSYTIIPVADGAGSYGLGYDDTRQISSGLDGAGVEAIIGSSPNLDENILPQINMYNDIVTQSGINPPDPVNGDVFNVSGDEWVLVAETDVIFTLIPVKDDPGGSGQLVYDDTRTTMRDLREADVSQFLGDPPTLNENIASKTLEFAAIKGAASTGLADGDVYIVNTSDKLLVVQESDSSYTIIPVADGAGSYGLGYDDTRQNEIRSNLDAAGVEAIIGATPFLDQNIAPFVNLYNDIVQAAPSAPADPVEGDVFTVSGSQLLLVEASNNSFTLIPIKVDSGSFVFDDTRSISSGLDKAGVENIIGNPPSFDENIASDNTIFDAILVAAAPSAPVITTSNGTVTVASPAIAGTAEAGTDVEVFSGSILIGSVTADSLGDWTLTPTTTLGQGNHSITATSTLSGLTSSASNTLSMAVNVPSDQFAGSAAHGQGYPDTTNSDMSWGDSIDVEFKYYPIDPHVNGALLGEIVYKDDPSVVLTISEHPYAANAGHALFRFDGNKVYLKDNFYYDTQYDHDGDANTAVVPAIRGFGDLTYHSNGNAQYTQEAARDFIADYDGTVYDRDHNNFIWYATQIYVNIGAQINGENWIQETRIALPDWTAPTTEITVTPIAFDGYETGATIANITTTNFDSASFNLNYKDWVFEIENDTIKLKDTWYVDPYTGGLNGTDGYMTSFDASDTFTLISLDTDNDINLIQSGFTINDLFSQVAVDAIPIYAGPPVADKIVPIDVIGHERAQDGDSESDIAAMDAAAAAEVEAIINAAGLSGPVSDGHIYKISETNNYLLAFEGSLGSETYSLIPVTRSDTNQPWQHDGTKSVISSLDLAGVTAQLGTAPVEHQVLGTIMQSNGKSTHYASDQYYHGQGLGDGDDIIITYSFVDEDSSYFSPDYNNPDPTDTSTKIWGFTDDQKNDVREALGAFSDVANIYFHEITETADTVGTFRFGMTDHALFGNTNAAGWASGPGGYAGGDIWIANYDTTDPNAYAAAHDMSPGTMGGLTLLHEIGHGLGLKHTFEHPVVDRSLESNTYSLMSYEAPAEAWYGAGNWAISHTPMILDIEALQFLYGAQTHNETATTYDWDETIPYAGAIWDSGGEDVLDLSNFSTDTLINLNPGTSSTIPFNYNNSVWTLDDNLGIPNGVVIENVKTGGGDDLIVGNAESNEITTGAGSDKVVLRAGDGGSNLADADKITDFSNGTDMLGLDDGLLYTDLTIAQGTDSNSSDTVISVGAEYLAILEGVAVADIDQDDFVAVDIA